jgi:two-component system chemotaxis response regulator CheB
MAASAGGVDALRRVLGALPAGYPDAICVVLHIPATGRSLLAPILDRDTALTAVAARDGEPLRGGTVYVAPADHHLLVRGDRVELSRGPKENGVRPSADPMFRTLAEAWGPGAVAVVLSGALDDGAAGAAAVADRGGVVIVQDPEDALVPGMPAAAIAATVPDHVVALSAVAGLLRRLAIEPVPDWRAQPALRLEPDASRPERAPNRPEGHASGFTCPECNGALWELRQAEIVRYRCRVGHSYSEEAMVEAQGAAVETALWSALEVLEERAELLLNLAGRLAGTHSGRHFGSGARQALERATLIRHALATGHAAHAEEKAAAR